MSFLIIRQLKKLSIPRKLCSFCFSPTCGLHHENGNTLEQVRVRFAPSPTGQLHLGGLRTALYNYLYAKSQNGKFILRIEDTDQSRLVPGATEKLIRMLSWAGLHIDEGPGIGGEYGPYVQSKRLSLYQEKIKILLENGSAYPCFCTPKRLELLRKEANRRGEAPRYDNRCRHLSPEEVQQKTSAGLPFVIRFKLERYSKPWEDLVYGPITYDVAVNEGDPILIKSDQFPTYHFANVVDDHFMNITHVLRGVEWQISTTKHILMYKAFGWKAPQFGHLPLIMNKDGSKLSKRQGDIHVEHFQASGYYPDSMLNLLTTAGSGFHVESTAGMNLDQLVKHFDLKLMRTNSSRLDLDRLDEFNQLHMSQKLKDSKEQPKLVSQLRELIKDKYPNIDTEKILSDVYISKVLDWSQHRIAKIEELCGTDYQFLWFIPQDATGLERLDISSTYCKEIIDMTVNMLESLDINSMSIEDLTSELKSFVKTKKLAKKKYMMTVRGILSGLKQGPSVSEMISVLGKENSLIRLKHMKCLIEQHEVGHSKHER